MKLGEEALIYSKKQVLRFAQDDKVIRCAGYAVAWGWKE
jgi:hypothetical protein